MLKIVREYQQICVEYLVDAKCDDDAIYQVTKNNGIEIDIVPEFISVLKREAREISDKDRKDPVFKRALDTFEYNKETCVESYDLDEILEMCRG